MQGLSDSTYPVALVPPTFKVETDKAPRTGSVRTGDLSTGYAQW